MASRLARLEDVTARNPGRTRQPGFRIARVFSPLRRQLVATSIISPAKPATSNTRSQRHPLGDAGRGGLHADRLLIGVRENGRRVNAAIQLKDSLIKLSESKSN